MNCQKCGIQNADDASFCSKCGNNIGKLKSIPIEKTTVEQLTQYKPKKDRRSWLRWIIGIYFLFYGIGLILLDSFGVSYGGSFIGGILTILISIVILPINKSIAGKSKSLSENKREYKNIDLRELEKNVSKFIDQKIRIYGKINWIEERDGNSFLIIDAYPEPHWGGLYLPLGHSAYIEYKGSIPILVGQRVFVFGVVKGKSEIQKISTGAKHEVPFIFATSISI